MAALTGRTIQDTYPFLLCVDHAGGLDTTVRSVQDGLGNASSLSLSTNAGSLAGTWTVTGTCYATAFDGDGSALTALNGTQVTTGTVALARGGTGASLSDPGADRLLFWDDSAGAVAWLTLGTGLTITGTTIDASGGGGGVSDGDKGDVTVSSSGTVWTIDADAVTFAKLLNATAESKLVGRGQGSAGGDFQEISLGSGLTMTGTTLAAAVTSVFGRTGAVVAQAGDYAVADITGAAALASPTFTGDPKAPTPSAGDNDTSIATTAYVQTELASFSSGGGAASAINLQGGYSSRPAAGTIGRIYRATDAPLKWRDNGASWDLYDPIYRPAAAAITIGSWTAANIGTGVVTDVNGSIFIRAQTNGSDQLRYYKKTLASATPYVITAVIVPQFTANTFRQAFVGVRQSGTSKITTWTITNATSSDSPCLRVSNWNSDTSFSADVSPGTIFRLVTFGSQPIYLRIEDDGTNRIYSWSLDDLYYQQFTTQGRTTHVTPDEVIFGTNCSTTTGFDPQAAFLALTEA